jgi:hypothetical protein
MASTGMVMLSIRVSQETKESIPRLAEAFKRELGTKISQTQAVEMAIAESLRNHCESNGNDS